ncbi:hypothetical protein 32HC_38 [Mycobacterium phage 32HC]|uniref:Uncharacterized protein n=1 Tax=Mycobacterium phage 32HC TaxID=1445729 RepID=W8EG54_9CAUD|nr:hypothetical protein ST32HC_38 [Mycobacterium phage 32HC]AHJ86316.1 hypothetical protein 32HC_38 [Mycobacterium phage 32HC]
MRIKIGRKAYKPSEIRKTIVVGAGMIVELGNQLSAALTDLVPAQVHSGISVVVGVAMVVGVFAVRNAERIDAADSLGE